MIKPLVQLRRQAFMKPYRSGNFVIGNRFLIDLTSRKISFHCRRTMQLLASKFPPDPSEFNIPAEAPAPLAVPQVLTDDERLAVYVPVIVAALARPAPLAGCRQSQEDAFWGTSLATRTAPARMTAVEAAEGDDDITARASVIVAQAVLAAAVNQPGTVSVDDRLAQAHTRPARRWTEADEELYQLANTWECAVYHWSEA
jgi:hypothetical protein